MTLPALCIVMSGWNVYLLNIGTEVISFDMAFAMRIIFFGAVC
jgi:hypothetical protein